MNGTWKRGRFWGGTRGRGARQRDGGRWRRHGGNLFPDKPSFEKRDMFESMLRPPRSPPFFFFSLFPPFPGVFELLNKNSGLCIKLQFGKTKLSGGIIILISKKKIKPLQIFLDYSALGDLFLPPSSSSSTIVEIFPTLPPTDKWKPLIITP